MIFPHLYRGILGLMLLPMPGAMAAQDTTAEALQASILGDAPRIEFLAEARAIEESVDPALPAIADELAALAAATTRPLPDQQMFNTFTSGYSTGHAGRIHRELLRREEPRTRLADARADRRYEQWRRAYNAIAGPAWGAVQGQFFGLFTMPLRALDSLFVGRRFLDPEQRKEAVLAKALPNESVDSSWEKRRQRLAMLQARLNAEAAYERGDLLTAEWWLQREADAVPGAPPSSSVRRDLQADLDGLSVARRVSLQVTANAGSAPSDAAEQALETLTTAFISPGGLVEFERQWGTLTNLPGAKLLRDDALAAQAAYLRRDGSFAAARSTLEILADEHDDKIWGRRAEALRQRPEWAPEAALERAQDAVQTRRLRYFISAQPLDPPPLYLTAEQARLERAFFFDRLRALFLFDALARVLTWPFLPSQKKPELIDAFAQAPGDWKQTARADEWWEDVAAAYRVARRYEDAAAFYEAAGEVNKARRVREKGARRLARSAEDLPGAAAVETLARAIALAPPPPLLSDLQAELQWAGLRTEALVFLEHETLQRYEAAFAETPINTTLFDGDPSNGEASEAGLLVLRELVAWRTRGNGRIVRTALTQEEHLRLLTQLERILRFDREREVLAKPRARRRVPLALEAGAFPGFEAAPGLVPLDPDRQERRLYE